MSTTMKLVIAGALAVTLLIIMMMSGSNDEPGEAVSQTPAPSVQPAKELPPSEPTSIPQATAPPAPTPPRDVARTEVPKPADSVRMIANPIPAPPPPDADFENSGSVPEELYGSIPEIPAEIQAMLDNPPPPMLPDNWDEIIDNQHELSIDIQRVLESPPSVQYDPDVERLFREQPAVPIPAEAQRFIDSGGAVPPRR